LQVPAGVQIGDHIHQVVAAHESHHLKTIHTRLINAAAERLTGELASEQERDNLAATRAAGNDQMRVRAAVRKTAMALNHAEIVRQPGFDQREQAGELRTQLGGHLAGRFGLLGILAEDGAMQMIPQPHVEDRREPPWSFSQDGFFRVGPIAQQPDEGHAHNHRGCGSHSPKPGARAAVHISHRAPDVEFQACRHRRGADRAPHLRAHAGERREFRGA